MYSRRHVKATAPPQQKWVSKMPIVTPPPPPVVPPPPPVVPPLPPPVVPPLLPPVVPPLMVPVTAPARSGNGSAGREYIIKANHFLVDIGNIDLHQYEVTIAPEVTPMTKRRDIMKLLSHSYRASHLGNLLLVYDGKKSAFAAGHLPFNSKEFVVKLPQQNGRDREFKVTIKFAARKELNHLRQFLAGSQQDNPKETIQFLDVVLRESPSKDCMIVRTYPIKLIQVFCRRLRPTQSGLSLSIDMSTRASFHVKQLLIEFVLELLGTAMPSSLTTQERIKVMRALKGLMVVDIFHHRRYKVRGLTAQPINQLKFIHKTGATKTVVQYFSEKYNFNVDFPALPAIQAGTDAKPIYLPMEICLITPDQRYAPKLNLRPLNRPIAMENKICNAIREIDYNTDPLVSKEFEMNVTGRWATIEARVLPPPSLCYRGCQSEVTPSVGQWHMSGLKVINGGIVKYWTIINFSLQNEEAVFKPQPLMPMRSAMPHTIVKALADLHSQASAQLAQISPGHHLQMLFVILPEPKGSYSRIKRVCETELGIVSQCCQPQHIMERSSQDFGNVALKINVKVGGRNTVLSAALNRRLPYVTDQPTIIFGADVTYPQPGEDSSPSIAAVTIALEVTSKTKSRDIMQFLSDSYSASHLGNLLLAYDGKKSAFAAGPLPFDSKGIVVKLAEQNGREREFRMTKFAARKDLDHLRQFLAGRQHDNPQETIQALDVVLQESDFKDCEIVGKSLFHTDFGRGPLSDGMENHMPPVTFIVFQNRHHTRFFPVRHGDGGSTHRSGNILTGTVVDTKICHPSEFDFYLCGHAGIQGTTRPTHYLVLYVENKFTADGLQMLTNSLCLQMLTNSLCTRSVSIVPPSYYAHLARSCINGEKYERSSCGQRATRDVSDAASCSDVLAAVNAEAHPSAKSTCSDKNVEDAQKGDENYFGQKMERSRRREDVLTRPYEESETFCKGVDHHKLLIDPEGKIYALNTKSNQCYWISPTGKASCIYLKDENQILEFMFSKSGREGEHVIEEDVDTMDCSHLFHVTDDGGSKLIVADSLESLQAEMRNLYGERLVVTGDIDQFWINLKTGQIYNISNDFDQREHIFITRRNYQMRHADNWELSFSTLQVSLEQEKDKYMGRGDSRSFETMAILHMRDVEQIYSFWQRFKITPSDLIVYYDTRERRHGREWYKGSSYVGGNHMFVTVEQVLPGESISEVNKEYFLIGCHSNLLSYYGGFTYNNQDYITFELFSYDLTQVDEYESTSDFEIMKGILQGAKCLYEHKRLHGNLEAKNVVFVDGQVKLRGITREAAFKAFEDANLKKEMLDLGNLLDFCFTKGNSPPNFWNNFEENNPVENHLINTLKETNEIERLALPQLLKHPIFWTFSENLGFFYKVSQFLKSSTNEAEREAERERLEMALNDQATKDRVFSPQKTTLHKTFLEHMDMHAIYRTYVLLAVTALLRVVRNATSHEGEIERAVAKFYGGCPEGLEKYFSAIYPHLLMATFKIVLRLCMHVSDFAYLF